MSESFLNGKVVLYGGDCLDILPTLDAESIDAVVCDPPYHLTSIVKRFGAEGAAPAKIGETGAFARASAGFMGKTWDGGDIAFQPQTWAAVLRVLKPGGYIIAFSSSRTFGCMSVALEDAGFITHPLIGRLFNPSGDLAAFLGSLSAEQLGSFCRLIEMADPVAGFLAWAFGSGFPKATRIKAEGYDGFRYGTQALKPALEPIYMGQKPFSEDTGTANILRWGAGAVNIDACRINPGEAVPGGGNGKGNYRYGDSGHYTSERAKVEPHTLGRWPANLIHDGSDEVVRALPDTGISSGGRGAASQRTALGGAVYGDYSHATLGANAGGLGDSGSAARFFYTAKADADDRIGSKHPTVKPVDLMRYLVRLVTPPGGVVLDPFSGTGTTGEAAWREGFRAVLIEREAEYQADIARRLALCLAGPDERKRAIIKERQRDKVEDHAGTLFANLFSTAAE